MADVFSPVYLFAAFRLSSVNGFGVSPPMEMQMNGVIVQGEKATDVDTKPEVGSIAWSTEGYYGHVALGISHVSGDTIEIEEYNYGVREKYNRRKVKASSMTGFIHFKDLSASHGASEGVLVAQSFRPVGTIVFTGKLPIMDQ